MTLYLETGFEGCGTKFPNTGYLLEKGDKSDVKIFSKDFHGDSDDIEQAEENWSLEFGKLVLIL